MSGNIVGYSICIFKFQIFCGCLYGYLELVSRYYTYQLSLYRLVFA